MTTTTHTAFRHAETNGRSGPIQTSFPFISNESRNSRNNLSGTFADNKDAPVHRWFRYSAGFSGKWAQALLHETAPARVLDPFAGCGTTLVAAEQCGVEAWGIDPHPFVSRIVRAKLEYRSADPDLFLERARQAIRTAGRIAPSLDGYAPLIRKCYTDSALGQLDSLKRAIGDMDGTALLWLALVSILRPTSHAGTANCQYILPNHKKTSAQEPFVAFRNTTTMFHRDMACIRPGGPPSVFHADDARYCRELPDSYFDFVLTSPPYPNNYDYADATRLEMTFLGEMSRWSDLRPVRSRLLRSTTSHVPDRALDLESVLSRPELDCIRDEIVTICEELGRIRLKRGGRKTYHNMIACYFLDLAQVWRSLRRVCRPGVRACFVIGDSAPYGVYVPVVDWLGRLAVSAGFHSFSFEKIRDRNIKWKNRKHRVPLCEGRLWVEG